MLLKQRITASVTVIDPGHFFHPGHMCIYVEVTHSCVLCIVWFSLSVFAIPLLPSTMTMEELLKSLQKKCRVECEEAHRQLVCALNGLAGIHIIRSINPHFCTYTLTHTFPWESVQAKHRT